MGREQTMSLLEGKRMKEKKTREISQLSTGGYPQAGSGGAAGLTDLTLPAYVCRQAWSDFVAMRLEMGCSLSRRAGLLVVKRLMALHAEGYCPTAALEKSVRCGWRDVYPGDRLAAREGEPAKEGDQARRHEGVPMPGSVRARLASLRLTGRTGA
jgi:hypothetical protein